MATLAGKKVIITRAAAQAAPLAAALEARGACAWLLPAIEIVPPDDPSIITEALTHIDTYRWVILTSINAVERFFEAATRAGVSLPAQDQRYACVGSSTADALIAKGITPDLVPGDFKAEGLMAEFDAIAACSDFAARAACPMLLPRAQKAREILPEHLRALGFPVTVAPVYKTVSATFAPAATERLSASHPADAVIFTSPSTVKHFFAALSRAGVDPRAFCQEVVPISIGAVSTAALVDHGIARLSIQEARQSTTDALIKCVEETLS